jgi:hypothetical protein
LSSGWVIFIAAAAAAAVAGGLMLYLEMLVYVTLYTAPPQPT